MHRLHDVAKLPHMLYSGGVVWWKEPANATKQVHFHLLGLYLQLLDCVTVTKHHAPWHLACSGAAPDLCRASPQACSPTLVTHQPQCSPCAQVLQHRPQLCWVGVQRCRHHVHTRTAAALAEPARNKTMFETRCQGVSRCWVSLSWLRLWMCATFVNAAAGAARGSRVGVVCCWNTDACCVRSWSCCCYCCAVNMCLARLTLEQNALEGNVVRSVSSACCLLVSSATTDSCLLMLNTASTVHSRPAAIIQITVRLRFGLSLRSNAPSRK
jgi:hypothetical protein